MSSSVAVPSSLVLGDLIANPDLFELRVLTLEETLASTGCDGFCRTDNERVPPFFQGVWGPLCVSCALSIAQDDQQVKMQRRLDQVAR